VVTRTTTVTSQRTITPDPAAGTDDLAVWDTTVTVTDAEGVQVSAFDERVAFDRRTSRSVAGHGQYYRPDADPAAEVEVDHTGHYFALPFDIGQGEYDLWDTTLQQTRPAVFAGEDEIDGLGVYRFEQEIEATQIAENVVPGRLFGAAEPSVTATRVYANTRTVWVEPRSGGIVRVREEPHVFLTYGEAEPVTVLKGAIADTDDTVAANVDRYADRSATLRLVGTTLPALALVLGVGILAGGLVLAWNRRRYRPKRAWGRGDGEIGSFDDLRGDDARAGFGVDVGDRSEPDRSRS
jgi:hypothetical protein